MTFGGTYKDSILIRHCHILAEQPNDTFPMLNMKSRIEFIVLLLLCYISRCITVEVDDVPPPDEIEEVTKLGPSKYEYESSRKKRATSDECCEDGFTSAERNAILNRFNTLRGGLGASNMRAMVSSCVQTSIHH